LKLKKLKPQPRVLTVETEGEFRKIKQLFPSINPIRYNEYIELRLPFEKNFIFNDKGFNIVRLKTK
jgi:hypothetical protein